MMRTVVVAAAVLLAACGDSGPAAAGQGHNEQASTSKLEVAGVRPGMSAASVKATMERAGWHTESFPGRDWTAAVAYEAGRQRGKMLLDQPMIGVDTIQAHKGDEQIIVSLQPSPSGSVVTQLAYSAPMAGRTGDQVRAQLVQRYGEPTTQSRAGAPLIQLTWCTGREACRSYYGATNPALLVEEDAYHKLKISMREGTATERARQAQLLAAAGDGAPPKSSF